MHDPKAIEAMARAICLSFYSTQWERTSEFRQGLCRDMTASALSGLCTLHPGVGAILRGEAVAVPREAIERAFREGHATGWDAGMQRASADAQGYRMLNELSEDEAWKCSNAFDAASPYAQEAARDE